MQLSYFFRQLESCVYQQPRCDKMPMYMNASGVSLIIISGLVWIATFVAYTRSYVPDCDFVQGPLLQAIQHTHIHSMSQYYHSHTAPHNTCEMCRLCVRYTPHIYSIIPWRYCLVVIAKYCIDIEHQTITILYTRVTSIRYIYMYFRSHMFLI